MNLGTARIIHADSRTLPIEDNSVDLVITSPPYFALRSYQDAGEHYLGQIGDEPTPAEFVESLLEVTRECVRVLKPSGSLWVNLGDKYANSPPSLTSERVTGLSGGKSFRSSRDRQVRDFGIRQKSLIGIPWRYALRCIDDLGLILRAEVIWSKPNGLPESVTDRVRRSHEQWFHFTLSPRYFSSVDEIREPHSPGTAARYAAGYNEGTTSAGKGRMPGAPTYTGVLEVNPLGKLPGSVWTVPTEPLRVPDHLGVDHFAAFPTEWPKRIIQGWSPAGVCVECGEGRRPVTNREASLRWPSGRDDLGKDSPRTGERTRLTLGAVTSTYTLTGYACACPEPTAPTTPGLVLDPFGGTGTTALVAKALGRDAVSVDMSADYCRLAEWRTQDRDQLAKVLGIEKADPVHEDEQSLLDLLEGGAA